jgi:hypothetical protein
MADVPSGPIPPPPPPPEGTPPGPGSLRPRTLGEILSAAFQIYKDNAQALIIIVAIVVVPLSFISALISHAVAGSTTTTTRTSGNFSYTVTTSSHSLLTVIIGVIVVAAIGLIISALLQAAMFRGAAEATIGDPVDVESSYRFGFRRIGGVIGVGLLVGLIVAVGLILLIVPGIIFWVFFSVSIPVLIIENRGVTQSMGRSWNLVSGHFWHVFGVIIVTYLIAAVVSGILGAIGGNNWIIRWILSAIGQIITTPFTALATVLLYLDLRARKEALTTDVLRSELASGR